MNAKEFLEAMGEINNSYIEEALYFTKKKRGNKWAVSGTSHEAIDSENNILIPEGISELYVTHIAADQEETYIISGADLEDLKKWADSLVYVPISAPSEKAYNNETYNFCTEDQYLMFSYCSYQGQNDWYLIINGNWYSVTNPTRPFL